MTKMNTIAVAFLACLVAASSAAAAGPNPDKKAILQQYELTKAKTAVVLKDGPDSARELLENVGITQAARIRR